MTRSFLLSLLGVLAFQPGLLADGKLAAGQKIIDFAEKDMAGNPLDTKAYRGKVVLLDFWATWCPPCREEIPHIVKAYEKLHPQGFEIIGISLDSENRAGLEQYLAQNKMTWPQYYDGKHWDTKLSKLYGLESIPHMYLVDEQGIVRHDRATLRGPGTLEKAVEELLAKRAQNPNVKLYEAALKAIAEKNWKLATDSRGALRKAGSEFAAALETEIAKVAARLADELKQAE